MAFGKGAANKGCASDLIVNSIAICAALPEQKKVPLVIVAYMAGDKSEICFTAMKFPVKKLYVPEDIFAAIQEAEGVKNITYRDGEGRLKDIYVCRESGGKITDVVTRDSVNNGFAHGFSEITSAGVKFTLENYNESQIKPDEKMDFRVSANLGNSYQKHSYEYALVNAYNACLLGKVFEREEFSIQTKSGGRVKIEVKCLNTEFIVDNLLLIKPVFRESDGFIEYYLTEEFNLYDGQNVSRQKYKISYTARLNDYNLIRL